jgi:hypothetical protein
VGRVFHSDATGASVYVFADDHCPPHVHARHRREDWIARVAFSFVHGATEVMSIAPLRNMPAQRVLNRLLDDIRDHLADCRRSWWTMRRTTCLANQWAVLRAGNAIDLLPARAADAKQIADATYDPTVERLHVIFRDAMAIELSLAK